MELIIAKNRTGGIFDMKVFAAFHKSAIVDIDYNREDIYLRTPDIKIDANRLKDLESNKGNDIDEVF